MNEKIEKMERQFIAAFSGTSFDPEKRGRAYMQEYSDELENDKKELSEKKDADQLLQYEEKYLSYVSKWLSFRGRCMSAFITGPANFPTERNLRAFNRERSVYDEFQAWRARYFNAVNRVRVKSPEDDFDDALIALEKEKEYHDFMKWVNTIIRGKGTEQEKEEKITAAYPDVSKDKIDSIFTPFCGKIGFHPFELTSSLLKIKRLENKLLICTARINAKKNFTRIVFPGGEINLEADRVIINHDDKPSPEVIQKLKKNGFHWSFKFNCWCRKHTAAALIAAKKICEVEDE